MRGPSCLKAEKLNKDPKKLYMDIPNGALNVFLPKSCCKKDHTFMYDILFWPEEFLS